MEALWLSNWELQERWRPLQIRVDRMLFLDLRNSSSTPSSAGQTKSASLLTLLHLSSHLEVKIMELLVSNLQPQPDAEWTSTFKNYAIFQNCEVFLYMWESHNSFGIHFLLAYTVLWTYVFWWVLTRAMMSEVSYLLLQGIRPQLLSFYCALTSSFRACYFISCSSEFWRKWGGSKVILCR